MKAVSLNSLVRGNGPLTPKQLKQARRWVDADWESRDIDRDAVKLIDRLLRTIDTITPPEVTRGPLPARIKEVLQIAPRRMSGLANALGIAERTICFRNLEDDIWDLLKAGHVVMSNDSYMSWVG